MEIKPQNPIQAVVFDAVGTVMYPSPSVGEAYQAAIEAHCGVRTDADLVRRTVNDALQQRSATNDLTTNESAERQFWAELIRTLCPSPAGFQDCFDELFEHFATATNWRCFPDVAGLVPALHSLGVQVAIASNFDRRLNRVCDGLAELTDIDCRIVSSLVGYRKPAPQFFDAVVAETGVTAANILMVGDDPINDIQGALSSGLQAALIDRDKTISQQEFQNVHLLSDLTQLPILIAKLNAVTSGGT